MKKDNTNKAQQLRADNGKKQESLGVILKKDDTKKAQVHADNVNKQESLEVDNMSSSPVWFRVSETIIVLGIVPLVAFFLFLHGAGVVSLTDTDVSSVSFGSMEELFANLEDSWNRFNGSSFISNTTRTVTPQQMRPGYQLKEQGAKAKHPVLMIPGFVTSGLEVWGGEECARKHFRQRLWGALDTVTTFFTDQECFLQHLALDPITGGDPNNGRIRLRPAQGFEAADYFMATYWVWDKLIMNLADVGYDASSMQLMSYDWRLSFPMLEERDGYFTKLRYNIEAYHKTSGQKVVLASHSMGGELVLYFFAWVTTKEKDGGGGGGAKWVDEHIHAFLNIAGTLLGVPKASTALVSGEFRESSVLLGTVGSMLETFFGRQRRKDLFTTWGSVWSMLPKGGDAIWGSGADMCNDTSVIQNGLYCKEGETQASSSSTSPTMKKLDNNVPMLQMTDKPATNTEKSVDDKGETCSNKKNDDEPSNLIMNNKNKELDKKISEYLVDSSFTTTETVDFLMRWGGGVGQTLSAVKWLQPPNNIKGHQAMPSSQTWHDPTITPLPYAPSLKIYCMYGVGSKSERAYFYKKSDAKAAGDQLSQENVNSSQDDDEQCVSTDGNNNNLQLDYDLPFVMDTSINDDDNDIKKGVKFVDGDGSVPLLSLGYMCADQWKKTDGQLNPSNVDVITREYEHRQSFHVDDPMRGGPQAADHVDILGNVDMTEDFLRVVTDFDVTTKVKTKIVSDIKGISQRVNQRR